MSINELEIDRRGGGLGDDSPQAKEMKKWRLCFLYIKYYIPGM